MQNTRHVMWGVTEVSLTSAIMKQSSSAQYVELSKAVFTQNLRILSLKAISLRVNPLSMPRVSLKEIAAHCGVTTATVSLALRNSPQISTTRKKEIQEQALKLGYRPDPALSLIARARWKPSQKFVGHRLALVRGTADDNSYAATLRDAIISSADNLGYHIEEFSLTDEANAEKLVKKLYYRGIRGAILDNVSSPTVARVFDGWVPVVITGLLQDAPATHHILPDHFNSARIAFRHVRNRGLQRILLALTPPAYRWHDAYSRASILRGAYDAPHEQEKPSPPQTIEIFEYYKYKTREEQQAVLREMVARFKPQVVLASNIVAYYHIGPPHYRIPEDVAFICLDLPKAFIGKIAGNYPQPEEVGRVCVDMLELQIQRSAFSLPSNRNTILVETKWFEGPTF